jgi:hypothetical protein
VETPRVEEEVGAAGGGRDRELRQVREANRSKMNPSISDTPMTAVAMSAQSTQPATAQRPRGRGQLAIRGCGERPCVSSHTARSFDGTTGTYGDAAMSSPSCCSRSAIICSTTLRISCALASPPAARSLIEARSPSSTSMSPRLSTLTRAIPSAAASKRKASRAIVLGVRTSRGGRWTSGSNVRPAMRR